MHIQAFGFCITLIMLAQHFQEKNIFVQSNTVFSRITCS
jgi:hypothetical protein